MSEPGTSRAKVANHSSMTKYAVAKVLLNGTAEFSTGPLRRARLNADEQESIAEH
jgi:hypothetical protein